MGTGLLARVVDCWCYFSPTVGFGWGQRRGVVQVLRVSLRAKRMSLLLLSRADPIRKLRRNYGSVFGLFDFTFRTCWRSFRSVLGWSLWLLGTGSRSSSCLKGAGRLRRGRQGGCVSFVLNFCRTFRAGALGPGVPGLTPWAIFLSPLWGFAASLCSRTRTLTCAPLSLACAIGGLLPAP